MDAKECFWMAIAIVALGAFVIATCVINERHHQADIVIHRR
jgi:hypothetical protein